MNEKEYLLTCLIEEASEVGQAASKVLRFGEDETGVEVYETENGFKIVAENNLEKLEKEFNELYAVLDMLADRGIKICYRSDLIRKKQLKLYDAMQYSKARGCLNG